jgi:hypothetical protein
VTPARNSNQSHSSAMLNKNLQNIVCGCNCVCVRAHVCMYVYVCNEYSVAAVRERAA